ncbi:MAG: PilZ domain-containing protein [Clostridia bacterium]|nr:PilZ domain-containing protein [Deltaproteobacteria bacterium]
MKKIEKAAAAQNRRELARVPPKGDHHVLLVLPSGEERLEPLLDLSPHGVAVLLRAQRDLQAGAFLPRVCFFTNGECTLQCQATVREVTPVTSPDGTLATKIGLRLELLDSSEPGAPPIDTYNEPEVVADTVANLVRGKTSLRVHANGDTGRGLASVEVTRFARDPGELTVRVTEGDLNALETGATCELRGESFGTRLSLIAELVENAGVALRFKLPKRLTVWRNRVGGRVRSLPDNLEVTFESPFTKISKSRPVCDLSAKGLAFTGTSEDGLLVGMLLPTLIVRLPTGSVHARGVVRNVRSSGEGLLVGVEFISMPDASTRVLESFVDSNLHPLVRPAAVADVPRLWPVYEQAGLFGRSHAALSRTTATFEPVRRTLMSRARDLSLHMVGEGDDTIYGTAELLRTYVSTWSLQHIALRESAQHLTADQMVAPLVEAALRRKEFAHLHAILDPEKSRVSLAKLRTIPPDESGVWWSEKRLVGEPTKLQTRSDDVQDAAIGDIEWIIERCGELMRPLERAAFDITAPELRLGKIQRLYSNMGLGRQRFVRMAFSVGGPLGFSLIEVTSPGVSFPGYGELVRLYPTRREPSAREDALLALADDAIRVQRENGVERTQFLLDPRDAMVMEAAGYAWLGARIEMLASRNGASQIVNFINLAT